jgi:hypothetical protein
MLFVLLMKFSTTAPSGIFLTSSLESSNLADSSYFMEPSDISSYSWPLPEIGDY